jgi:DNA-binding MarR family transcriptional regulator
MNKQLEEAKTYLQEVLGIVDKGEGLGNEGRDYWGEPWADASRLPFYLQDLYTFNRAEVLGKPCLLMMCRAANGETPAVVHKHWKVVSSRYSGDVIYVVEGVSSFNRKRLIEQRVPFLVPGNQLYLPMLGIDLREYFKQSKKSEKQWLSAAAQVLVLRELLGSDTSALPAKELAFLLGYSAMTLTRAIKELVDRGLAMAEMVGREKHLAFSDHGHELWAKAKHYMHSPIKKCIWVAEHNYHQLVEGVKAKKAGESALAEYSMMADPKNRVIAINTSEWPGIKTLMKIDERDERDVDCIQIELWRYNPGGITTDESVDPLSLWLSLEYTKDERIEMARDELIENIWSKPQW